MAHLFYQRRPYADSAALLYWLLFFLVFPIVATADPAPVTQEDAIGQSEQGVEERWYTVSFGTTPAGHMLLRESHTGDRLITETEMEMVLKRGGLEQAMTMASRFVETTEGQPIEAWARQSMGLQPTETAYTFRDQEILIRRQQGKSVMEETVPMPTGWTTPGGSHQRLVRALEAGEQSLTLRSLDPLMGPEPVELQWQREPKGASLRVGDATLETTVWKQTQSFLPGLVSTVELDTHGRMVRTRTPMMGLEMVISLSNRDQAQDRGEAPELLIRSFVRPNRPIERPRQATTGLFALSLDDESPLEIPNLGAQTVRIQDGRAIVRVELGSAPQSKEEPDLATYLRPSLYADFESPLLARLREEALEGADQEPSAQAEALRAFVHRYLVRKDLGSLFATATEAATNQSGDCTEHSVLLMALLRGAGIPSRAVSGLIYAQLFAGAEDIFGYHMWTQAFLDGRWVDLDATLQRSFDATHIAFGTSALANEGDMALDLADVVQVMGKLRVEVLQIGHAAESPSK